MQKKTMKVGTLFAVYEVRYNEEPKFVLKLTDNNGTVIKDAVITWLQKPAFGESKEKHRELQDNLLLAFEAKSPVLLYEALGGVGGVSAGMIVDKICEEEGLDRSTYRTIKDATGSLPEDDVDPYSSCSEIAYAGANGSSASSRLPAASKHRALEGSASGNASSGKTSSAKVGARSSDISSCLLAAAKPALPESSAPAGTTKIKSDQQRARDKEKKKRQQQKKRDAKNGPGLFKGSQENHSDRASSSDAAESTEARKVGKAP